MSIKKILKWGGLISLIWIIIFLSNEFFIRDWRIEHSEQNVQKSIVKNYKDKEEKFERLIKYVRKLEITPIAEIEFIKNIKINSYLNSPFNSDSISINTTPFDFTYYDFEDKKIKQAEFEFLHDGKARIGYLDTIIETNNWHWNFEGGNDNPHFEKFIGYLGISDSELERLRKLIKEANCEAISIYHDSSFSLRYDGISFCQYEYFIPNEKTSNYKDYYRLDDEIFCGLNRNKLFCGYVIYDK